MSRRKIEDLMQCVDADWCRTVVSESPKSDEIGLYDTLAFIVAISGRGENDMTAINPSPTIVQALKARGFVVEDPVPIPFRAPGSYFQIVRW